MDTKKQLTEAEEKEWVILKGTSRVLFDIVVLASKPELFPRSQPRGIEAIYVNASRALMATQNELRKYEEVD